MADRIAVMAAGRLQQVGTPREVYETPANLFVAGFIGTPPMNTVPGAHRRAARVARRREPLRARAAAGHRRRPRRSSSASGPSTCTIGADGAVQGVVRHVEWLGHEALVTCERRASRATAGSRCASSSAGAGRRPRCDADRRPLARSAAGRTCTSSTPSIHRARSVADRREEAASPTPGGCTEAGHGRACSSRRRSSSSWSSSSIRSSSSCSAACTGTTPRARTSATSAGRSTRRPRRRRVPRRALAQRPVRHLHRARRPGPRHAPRGGRQPQAPRHQGLPDDLLLDHRHVGPRWRRSSSSCCSTRRSACSRASNLASATRPLDLRRCSACRCRRSGRTSACRSSSSWPASRPCPTEVDEAATLDGYGPVRRFFRITLPLISPVLLFLVVVLVVFALQAFAQIEFLTGAARHGPPRRSSTRSSSARRPTGWARARCMSVGLFVVTFVVTLAQFSSSTGGCTMAAEGGPEGGGWGRRT